MNVFSFTFVYVLFLATRLSSAVDPPRSSYLMKITHLASQIDSHANTSTDSSVHSLRISSRSEHSDSSALVSSPLNESLRFFFLIRHAAGQTSSYPIDFVSFSFNPGDNLRVVEFPLNCSWHLKIQIFLKLFFAFFLQTLPPKPEKFGFFQKLLRSP